MQTIDGGFCRPSTAGQAGATQDFRGFHGSFQDRADYLVRATVLSELGQSVDQDVGCDGRHSHGGIRAVAAAIRKVLSGQDVTGTDAADDVLKKTETSLHNAAQALADRGVDARTIDATIDKFRAQLANALDGVSQRAGTDASAPAPTPAPTPTPRATPAPSPTPAPVTTTSVSEFVSREVRKERGAIDLVTAEGDRVSIRFRTKEVVTDRVTQSTSSDGTTTTAAKSSAFSRGGVKIEVDGDLNEDELAAAYGHSGTSVTASTQPPASSSSGDGVAPAGSASGSTSGSGSATGGSTTTPASGTSASDSSGSSSSANGSTADDSGSSSTNGTPTSNTSDTPLATTPPASAQKTIVDFINDALSKLGSAGGAGRLSFSMHWKTSVLVTAIQAVQPAEPTTAVDQAAANTQLLSGSLLKIASA